MGNWCLVHDGHGGCQASSSEKVYALIASIEAEV